MKGPNKPVKSDKSMSNLSDKTSMLTMNMCILRSAISVSVGYATLICMLVAGLLFLADFGELNIVVWPIALVGLFILSGLLFVPVLIMFIWPKAIRKLAWISIIVSIVFPIFQIISASKYFSDELARGVIVEGKGVGIGIGLVMIFSISLCILAQAFERSAWKAGIITTKIYMIEAVLLSLPITVWIMLSVNGFQDIFAVIYSDA